MSAVEQFLEWAERDRLRSPHTLERYRSVLRQFPDPVAVTQE